MTVADAARPCGRDAEQQYEYFKKSDAGRSSQGSTALILIMVPCSHASSVCSDVCTYVDGVAPFFVRSEISNLTMIPMSYVVIFIIHRLSPSTNCRLLYNTPYAYVDSVALAP